MRRANPLELEVSQAGIRWRLGESLAAGEAFGEGELLLGELD